MKTEEWPLPLAAATSFQKAAATLFQKDRTKSIEAILKHRPPSDLSSSDGWFVTPGGLRTSDGLVSLPRIAPIVLWRPLIPAGVPTRGDLMFGLRRSLERPIRIPIGV
jgi:hypothetical protein